MSREEGRPAEEARGQGGATRGLLVGFPVSMDLMTSAQMSPQCPSSALCSHGNVEARFFPKFP